MIIDYRTKTNLPVGRVTVTDAVTGEPVQDVFYYNDESHVLGRYLRDEAGQLYSLKPDYAADVTVPVIACCWERRRVTVAPRRAG